MILSRDQIFTVVCYIHTQVSSADYVTGTGVFICKDNTPYLVTASHVANSTNENTLIIISDADSKCITLPLLQFSNPIKWSHHPVADMAALKVDMNSNNQTILTERCFPYDQCVTNKNPVSRDNELTTVGFPNGLGVDKGNFCPLTFRSYASSSIITLQRFDNNVPSDFFCLESPGVGGYSGGPVFDLGYMIVGSMTTTKENTFCYGIIHGTISDMTGGKLAAVTPMYYLKDLV